MENFTLHAVQTGLYLGWISESMETTFRIKETSFPHSGKLSKLYKKCYLDKLLGNYCIAKKEDQKDQKIKLANAMINWKSRSF